MVKLAPMTFKYFFTVKIVLAELGRLLISILYLASSNNGLEAIRHYLLFNFPYRTVILEVRE